MAIEQITLRPDLGEALAEDARHSKHDVTDMVNEAIEVYLRDRQRRKIDQEIEAYIEMHADLWKQIPEQWVAIHNGELVDQDIDRVALHRRVHSQYRRIAVLIRQVRPDGDEVIWWRTPSTGKLTE
jgi:hypothetical protein